MQPHELLLSYGHTRLDTQPRQSHAGVILENLGRGYAILLPGFTKVQTKQVACAWLYKGTTTQIVSISDVCTYWGGGGVVWERGYLSLNLLDLVPWPWLSPTLRAAISVPQLQC